MQHEMQSNLLGVHYLLYLQRKLLHVAVLVLALHEGGVVVARDEVLGEVGAEPALASHDRLGLVVDVVDWAGQRIAVLELERPEHGDRAKVEVIYEVVVVFLLEVHLALPHDLQVQVDYEVVVDNPVRVLSLRLGLVGNADRQQLPSLGLPRRRDCAFHSGQVVLLSNRVLDLVVMVGALWVFSEIEGLELKLLIVPALEPDDHGVVVALPGVVLIGPLIFLGLVDSIGLLPLERVGVVAELEAMVVVPAELLDAEQAGIRKGLDVHLVRLLIHELVVVLSHLVALEVQHGYLVLAGLQDDYFLVAHHAKGVDVVLQQAFVEDLALLVAVHQDVLALRGHAEEDEGFLERSREVQDFEVLLCQFHLELACQQHLSGYVII